MSLLCPNPNARGTCGCFDDIKPPPLPPEVVDLLNAAYDMAAEVAATPSPGISYTRRENALMAAGEMWDRAGRPGLVKT